MARFIEGEVIREKAYCRPVPEGSAVGREEKV